MYRLVQEQSEKMCRCCLQIKPIEEFTKRTGDTLSRQSWCKKCVLVLVKKSGKAWAATDRGKYSKKVRYRKWYDKRREIVNEKKNVPCQDCGIKYHPYVMDFDHVRGKKVAAISKLHYRDINILLEEIAKCDVVCANCHRQRTLIRRKAKRNMKC